MKKLISAVFAACVALAVLSVPAWGYGDDTVAVIGSAEYISVKAAAAAAAIGDTITMVRDSDETESVVIETGTETACVTLDLNGHTLNGKGTGPVITVGDNAFFVLDDSSAGGGGTVTRPSQTCAARNDGTTVRDPCTGTCYDLTKYPKEGGGILVKGRCTMKGGTISGCVAAKGGGVMAGGNEGHPDFYGTFTMEGGTITGCIAGQGGGVYSIGDVFIKGGTITGCVASIRITDNRGSSADGEGGGVFNNLNFKIYENGCITKCFAEVRGGGVFNSGKMQLYGGSIKNCISSPDNTSDQFGGGIFNGGSLLIRGSAVVTDNYSNTYSFNADPATYGDDISLYYGGTHKLLTVDGNFSGKIGINATSPDADGRFGTITGDYSGYENFFINRRPNYAPLRVGDGLFLKPLFTLNFSSNGHGTQPPAQQVIQGEKATETNTSVSAEGYWFEGWYRENGCINKWDFSTDTVVYSTTLYAGWSELLTVPASATDLVYDGTEKTGVVFDGNKLTASGHTGTDAGDYAAVMTPKDWFRWQDGSKTGITVGWSIAPAEIGSAVFEDIGAQTHTGSPLTPSVKASFGGAALTEGTDYTCSYENNTEAGTASVTVTGIGNFTGSAVRTFEIAKEKTTGGSGDGTPLYVGSSRGKYDGLWLEGANQQFTDSGSMQRFRVDVPFSKFRGVAVDGKAVYAYRAYEGSTVVELDRAFVDTLSDGMHTLSVQFSDGTAETNFYVGSEVNPETGAIEAASAVFGALALICLSYAAGKK